MTESESVALPLGDAPMQRYYYIPKLTDVKKFFKFFKIFLDFLFKVCYSIFTVWGRSSAGRALEWHSRGQEFDPLRLHQKTIHHFDGSFFIFGEERTCESLRITKSVQCTVFSAERRRRVLKATPSVDKP